MLIRKSSQGYDLKLYRNNTPGATRTKTHPNGDVETLTYPNRYKYFLILDGEIIRRSDSWDTIEQLYVDECESRHGGGKGRVIVGKHKLVNHMITELGS